MSDNAPLGFLVGALLVLLVLSAFFSGTETALVSLNRYRLRHKARSGNKAAQFAEILLRRPDRLITLILIGNNLVNFTAAGIAATITLRLFGTSNWVSAAGTFVFTLVVVIFSEAMPKTLGALSPERLALPAALIYYPLLKISYPLIWLVNFFSNSTLRLFGVDPEKIEPNNLTMDELRVIINEAGALLPRKRRRMLQGILELEAIVVDDVMVPHNEIVGVDLEQDWSNILQTIHQSRYTRLPVYRDNIDNVAGILNLRSLISSSGLKDFDRAKLLSLIEEPYFVPEGTPLNVQLVQFQHNRQRTALVVDEYGDIQGLVTLEDIIEEIVGEFTPTTGPAHEDVTTEVEGATYLVNASATIRSLNRTMHWNLPTEGAKTLNGLILEKLQAIPDTGTALQVGNYKVDIVGTSENAVNQVRVHCPRNQPEPGSVQA